MKKGGRAEVVQELHPDEEKEQERELSLLISSNLLKPMDRTEDVESCCSLREKGNALVERMEPDRGDNNSGGTGFGNELANASPGAINPPLSHQGP